MWLYSGPLLQDTKMPQNLPETYWQGQAEEMRHLRMQHQWSDRPSFQLIIAIINNGKNITSAGLLLGERQANTTDSPFYRNKREQQLEKSNPWPKMLRRRRGGMRWEGALCFSNTALLIFPPSTMWFLFSCINPCFPSQHFFMWLPVWGQRVLRMDRKEFPGCFLRLLIT